MSSGVNAGRKEETGKSSSKTVAALIKGEHEHTIEGYSLVKGIGDGEPIASERFTVGGHEWVLLFYPDGKRSSTSEGPIQAPQAGQLPQVPHPQDPRLPAPGGQAPNGPGPHGNPPPAAGNNAGAIVPALPPAPGPAGQNAGRQLGPPAAQVLGFGAGAGAQGNANPPGHLNQIMGLGQAVGQGVAVANHRPREANDYAALFVALIGETSEPQGVVNTSDGRVVRAFHRFTLVDQANQGRDMTKGRRRDQPAVKISCARQDPNARNCHGYRKFVKRNVLENPNSGFLVKDTIVIRYTIELVVSSGGALAKQTGPAIPKAPVIDVPPPALGKDLAQLLDMRQHADVVFKVEEEEMCAQRVILAARSPVFDALLNGEMREGKEGVVTIQDVRPPVFRALLYFAYTDELPEEVEGVNLDVPMAQHLLVAADRFQLLRLRRICESRLCETVEVPTVATTLTLAEQNHAEELKRVCLEFVSRNLQAVMQSDGYRHMVDSCPQLQSELLHTIAQTAALALEQRGHQAPQRRPRDHPDAAGEAAGVRRVRARVE